MIPCNHFTKHGYFETRLSETDNY